ncbi:MAG: DUF1579 family protein [Candidatus Acidiferrum sp.]|jgi:hypothetical protein
MAFPRCFAAFLVFAFILLPSSAVSQDFDGTHHVFTDPLLDQMTGAWNLTGKVMGRSADHVVEVEWVLNHQFLRIHEKDRSPAATAAVPYEAMIMVGYDNTSERYVAHWNDIYGGRFSETLGYGTRNGNDIRFVFEYPDGPFHTTFRWLPESHQWAWLMESKNKSGQWTEFAMLVLARASKP